jgi:ribosomal protein L12E/L44/L45/RPP1/RPP2
VEAPGRNTSVLSLSSPSSSSAPPRFLRSPAPAGSRGRKKKKREEEEKEEEEKEKKEKLLRPE